MNMICALVFLMACVGSLAIPITTQTAGTEATTEATTKPTEVTTAAAECGTGGTSVNSEQQDAITAQLNAVRFYSPEIKWDETLASLAQARAATCPDEIQNEILDCADAEVDEIVQFMPQSEFDVATFTQYMYKNSKTGNWRFFQNCEKIQK